MIKIGVRLVGDNATVAHSFAIALGGFCKFQVRIYRYGGLTHDVEMHPDASGSQGMTFSL